jgi:hypothetical protein
MFLQYFDLVSILPLGFALVCVLNPAIEKLLNRKADPGKLAYGATSLGVLLTFFGIWQGLQGFDVTDTEASIPTLLEGLKLAFGSSITGLFTSLFINLLYVDSREPEERSLANMEVLLADLKTSLDDFTINLTNANIEALGSAVDSLVSGLEMGINTETQETIGKFKDSVDTLRSWQEKYMDEIASVTEAMDKNAVVTKETTRQLDRTNDVLAELGPVTERIAESIGWVQHALPAFRKRTMSKTVSKNKEEKKDEEN